MRAAVISPYDLQARSEAMWATLLLAEQVITLRPAPFDGVAPEQLRSAAAHVPAFAQLVQSWAWSGPLWRDEVLVGQWRGIAPIEAVQGAARRLAAGADALSTLVGASRFESTDDSLQAICHDVLRGGRDPGIALPVAIGLEDYAGRIGAPLLRGAGQSLAARHEARQVRTEGHLTCPALIDVSADDLLACREACRSELEALRTAMEASVASAQDAADTASSAVSAWLAASSTRGRGVAVRLTFGWVESGTARSAAAAAIGAAQGTAPGQPTGAAMARLGTRVATVKILPWELKAR